jgi:hypothetical protein
MTRSRPPRKDTYFEPMPPRLARNTIIESTFEVGRRFRCAMRVDCGKLDPGAVIWAIPGWPFEQHGLPGLRSTRVQRHRPPQMPRSGR